MDNLGAQVLDFMASMQYMIATFGLRILSALAVFIAGQMIAKSVRKGMVRLFDRTELDETLEKFLVSLVYYLILVMVMLAAINIAGVPTTSFLAVLGAAGLAIGLALQGSLGNFAAGVLMIIFKPFKVGDFIEGAGVAGTVEEIQIFTTQLKTPDNKTVIVPNAKMTGDNITNYTVKGTRRVDFVFGIGYEDDIDKARKVIEGIITEDKRVLKDPAPMVAVSELADSSVNFVARAWTSADDYWGFYFETTEKVKKQFDAEGISIPYPQRDIHVYEHKE